MVEREDILKHIIDLKDVLGDLKSDVSAVKENIASLVETSKDQEERIRKLESKSWKLAGSIAAITFILGIFSTLVPNFLTKG